MMRFPKLDKALTAEIKKTQRHRDRAVDRLDFAESVLDDARDNLMNRQELVEVAEIDLRQLRSVERALTGPIK